MKPRDVAAAVVLVAGLILVPESVGILAAGSSRMAATLYVLGGFAALAAVVFAIVAFLLWRDGEEDDR